MASPNRNMSCRTVLRQANGTPRDRWVPVVKLGIVAQNRPRTIGLSEPVSSAKFCKPLVC